MAQIFLLLQTLRMLSLTLRMLSVRRVSLRVRSTYAQSHFAYAQHRLVSFGIVDQNSAYAQQTLSLTLRMLSIN